ncbi:MAG: hypothetical protein JWM90_2505 [Thermoleophilia bacterium]|nr:hypothetical protein [Thermoleophilia bacterium]
MPRALRFSTATITVLAVLVVSLGLGPAAWAAPAPIDPATSLGELPPLQPKRTGISENEPDYCPDTVQREPPNEAATNTNSLDAGPTTFLVKDLQPSTSYRHCVYLFNRKKTARTFELSTLDVIGSLDPKVRLTTEEPRAMGTWIKLLSTTAVLQPGERIKIPYMLAVPANPPAGSLAAGIRISDVTQQATTAGAAIQAALVLQVQAIFPGGESRKVTIKNAQSPRLLVRGSDSPRVNVSYVLANEGTVVSVVTPTLNIGGLFGRNVAEIKSTSDVVTPGSAQQMRATWEGVPWIGWYRPSIDVKNEAGTQRVKLPALWIIPPWPIIAAFLVALALVLYAAARRRAATGWKAYLDDEDDDPDAEWNSEGDTYR